MSPRPGGRRRKAAGGRRRGRPSLSKFAAGDLGGVASAPPSPAPPLCRLSGLLGQRLRLRGKGLRAGLYSNGGGGRSAPGKGGTDPASVSKGLFFHLRVSCAPYSSCYLGPYRRRRWAGPRLLRAEITQGEITAIAAVPTTVINAKEGHLGLLSPRGSPSLISTAAAWLPRPSRAPTASRRCCPESRAGPCQFQPVMFLSWLSLVITFICRW